MAQPFVTGPVSLWVALDNTGTPSFLGHGEEAPEIEHRPQYEPVMCDLTGTRVPMDVADENEDAIISVNLVRWNEDVLMACQKRPGLVGQAAPRGSRGPTDLGTLYLTEGAAFFLWVFFPYSSRKAAYAAQPAGYRYFGAYLLGPDSLRKNGTRARTVQCLFHALPTLAYQGNVPTGGTTLYDHDMSAVKALPIN